MYPLLSSISRFNSSFPSIPFSCLHPHHCCFMCVCVQPTNLFPLLSFKERVRLQFCGLKLCSLCACRLIWSTVQPGKMHVEYRTGGELRWRSVGGSGRRDEGRAWYEGGGAPRQLSCEEANGLSSPSHAHRVFSDGHSSGETHIGLATGTELQPQCSFTRPIRHLSELWLASDFRTGRV